MIHEKEPLRDAISVIRSRRSVREFTGETVGEKDLETILRAGIRFRCITPGKVAPDKGQSSCSKTSG